MSENNQNKTAPMTMIQALRSAMDVMLERDNNVVVFGQDVGYFGGVFRCTEGLQKKYSKSRVFDAPISEKRHRRSGDWYKVLMVCAPALRFNLLITFILPTIKSCLKQRVCVSALLVTSPHH